MYEYSPIISSLYDNVPIYASRPDVRFYVDEAKASGGAVVEVGCGTGRVLIPVARAGITVHGLDASEAMLAECKARLAKEPGDVGERVTLHRGDARSFDLGRRFSLVTAPFRVVQHLVTIDDQLRFLDTVKRHLTPDGRLVFDVFNPSFSVLATADGLEHEDTPETPLPNGGSFRRTGAVKRIRWIDQVSEVELAYYVTKAAGAKPERFVQAFDMRWYLRAELVHLLARAAYRVERMYGDFDRSPVTDSSKELIVVAAPLSP
jgi:SAM-dependent methyltransferase